MQIGAINVGYRGASIQDQPIRWYSMGVSMAGTVSTLDFGHKQQDIIVVLPALSQTLKNTLKSYLMDTIKPGGVVSVTPDSGDDLQIGAVGAVNLIFLDFLATRLFNNIWQTTVTFRNYT